MIELKDIIEVGFLYKPHGYKGEINAEFDYDGNILCCGKFPFIINIDGIFVPFFIQSFREKGHGKYLVKLKGINNDVETSILINHTIYMLKTQISEATGMDVNELEQFFTFEEARVFDYETKRFLGYVKDMEEGKEYDYLVADIDGREVKIPTPFIVEVEEQDNATGSIFVDLPDGLIDLN